MTIYLRDQNINDIPIIMDMIVITPGMVMKDMVITIRCLNLAQKLLRNKAILAGIVLTILIIGAVGIWLIVTLLPYLGQVISMAEKQGIKGILETITPFLQKIWEGAGK